MRNSKAVFAAAFALSFGASTVFAVDETRRIEGLRFDEVVVVGAVDVEIRQGSEIDLEVRGPKEQLDAQPFYVKGSILVVGPRKTTRSSNGPRRDERLRFRLLMPELQRLKVKGSGSVFLKSFQFSEEAQAVVPELTVDGSGEINAFDIRGAAVELRVEGSGDVRAETVDVDVIEAVVTGSGNLLFRQLQARSGEFVVTGSGDLKVFENSFVNELEVNVIGSGDASLGRLDCERAEVNVIGSGDASIGEVSGQLNATILGSGDISYRGSPVVEMVELGSGDVRRRD